MLVGLGGNQGGDDAVLARFRSTERALAGHAYVRGLRRSPLYRSDPIGLVVEQPAFLNAALAFELREERAPGAILSDLLAIEVKLGRCRAGALAQGPRSIDLDLLAVGSLAEVSAGPPALVLPHPRMCARAFVLRPLAALLGKDFLLPGAGRTIAECLADPAVAGQRLCKLPDPEV